MGAVKGGREFAQQRQQHAEDVQVRASYHIPDHLPFADGSTFNRVRAGYRCETTLAPELCGDCRGGCVRTARDHHFA